MRRNHAHASRWITPPCMRVTLACACLFLLFLCMPSLPDEPLSAQGMKPKATDTSREESGNEVSSEQRETETQDQEAENEEGSEDDEEEETDGGEEEGVEEEESTKEQDGSNQQDKEDQQQKAEEGGNNQDAKEDPASKTGQWSADQKVAWIVPFLAAPAMPTYASFCFNTIAYSSPHVQVFVFYENSSMILPPVEAKNIHFINIQPNELATRLVQVMTVVPRSCSPIAARAIANVAGLDSALDGEAVIQTLRNNPRKVGVYKPLLGAAFHDFINGFSHWAWGDIDLLVGDIRSLVSAQDLRTFDIISFNNGKGLLYLQGQLTILANRPEVVNAWKSAPAVYSLMTTEPAYAWEETKFTDWVLHDSSLQVKLMPLQFSGKDAKNWAAGDTLIWENGRLLVHFGTAPVYPSLETRIEAPLLPQPTWTQNPQRPGPYIVERYGSDKRCVWYGYQRPAHQYDNRTQEYIIFHYNYLHEQHVPNALAKKSEDEIKKLLKKPRLSWQYYPFDFMEAPPCGTVGGGHCPSELAQPSSNVDAPSPK